MRTTELKKLTGLFFSFVVSVFVLTSFTVTGQRPSAYTEEHVEQQIEVEVWMTNLEGFFAYEEESIEVESWMTDLSSFYSNDEEEITVEEWMFTFADEIEAPLAIEEWMTDLNSYASNEEDELPIESWMTSLDEFLDIENNVEIRLAMNEEQSIELKEWMTDINEFLDHLPLQKLATIQALCCDEEPPTYTALHTSKK
ncbi:hypothetical protein DMA11_13045 [Marinilabiliaceae bacterium JC017]|nr:hypothetical protein DMA11_13045 [Marinilabiliaceae bacterium JC017]